MLTKERFKNIISLLRETGVLYVSDLSNLFNVSEETIRRDLTKLEKEGLLYRIHGGAISFDHTRIEPSYKAKLNVNIEEKRAIAIEAAKMVEEGDSIILDASTTTFFFARELKNKKNITIVTNYPLIIQELADVQGINIISTGGILNRPTYSLVGPVAEEFIKGLHVDKTFISTKAISIDDGLTEGDLSNIAVKKCMINAAKETILLADSSKFKQSAFAQLAPISTINIIITDDGIDSEYLLKLRENGIEIIVAQRLKQSRLK